MDLRDSPLPLKDNGFSMTPPKPCDTPEDEMERLKEELKKWKERVERAEKAKADLLLSKISADEEYFKAEEEFTKLKDLQEKQLQQQFSTISQENAELKKEIEQLREDFMKYSSLLSQSGQIKKKVAEVQMKFSHMEYKKEDCLDMDTHCYFTARTKIPFRLNQNQALITFEDEEVAQRLLKKGKHTLILDKNKTDMKVIPFTLDMGIKFELHITISGKKINVSEIPDLSIPDDWMRDKLELNFYKPGQGGGGEVEAVKYDRQSRTAVITFLKPGAAQSIARCMNYPFLVSGRCFRLSVSPATDMHLEKFQVYCGISKKTLLVKGIQGMDDDEESVQDMIEIHFQRPSNGGGEIEAIKYVSDGATWVCFEEDNENVRKEIGS